MDQLSKIKKYHSKHARFIDNEFPPIPSTLGAKIQSLTEIHDAPVIWKRPHDISNNPKFIIDGISADDIEPGTLIKDDWFVFAIESLVERDYLTEDWIKKDQSFSDKSYTGAFVFNFFKNGEMKQVIIDDYLPTINGKLIGVFSKTENEFWGALMEKAYAKMNGSYSCLVESSAIKIFTEICGFFDLRIDTESHISKDSLGRASSKGLNANKLALIIDQGVLMNTGPQPENDNSEEKSITDFNFSVLKYDRPDGDILGDGILFTCTNPMKPEFSEMESESINYDIDASFELDFDDLVKHFKHLTLIFDTGVWRPVSKYFRLEDAKPQKFETPLSYKNRSELNDDQYMILEKRSRSHLLCSVTSENINVSFGLYSYNEDGTLTCYYSFEPRTNTCTRYLEVAKGDYVFMIFNENGEEVSETDGVKYSVYEEQVLESIRRRSRLQKKKVSELRGKTTNFIHSVFDRQDMVNIELK